VHGFDDRVGQPSLAIRLIGVVSDDGRDFTDAVQVDLAGERGPAESVLAALASWRALGR